MSVCGSLQHMFEKPCQENPTLIGSLSRNQTKQPLHSFTHLFGELYFMENPINHTNVVSNTIPTAPHKKSDSFSSFSSESLLVCTEGLGFESSDDVEESKNEVSGGGEGLESDEREKDGGSCYEKKSLGLGEYCRRKRLTSSRVSDAYGLEHLYPPPISCMGSFMSYRDNGRFVLKEIRTPSQEFLLAQREDGRLKLHFVQPEDEEFMEEEEEEGDGYEDADVDADADGSNHGEEEKEYDEVDGVDKGEEDVGKENDQSVTDIK